MSWAIPTPKLLRFSGFPKRRRHFLAAMLCFGGASHLLANPVGPVVRSGTASTTTTGSHLDITASHNAFLDWQSFNIAAGETTTFHQPSAASIVWNRINDPNPSQIFGRLDAN